MGLLDQVIGGVVGQVLGGGRGGGNRAGGIGGALASPIVRAIAMLLLAKAAKGGLGNIFGGGHEAPSGGGLSPRRQPQPDNDGDLGGFGQIGGPSGGYDRGPSRADPGGGEFSDLSGMLDGPGDQNQRSPGAGPYAHLDHEPGQAGGDGLGGLINSFEQSGLGDVIGSWIGRGDNRSVAPNRLADALGADTVDSLSQQTGLNRDELLSQLSAVLPGVIDQLTPHGRLPSEEERRGW